MTQTLSGFLLWTGPEVFDAKAILGKRTRLRSEREYVDGWREYDYVVTEHISSVDVQGDPPYVHRLYARWGGGRLIILSNHYRICDHYIEQDLRQAVVTPLRRADIAIHNLVLAMTEGLNPEVSSIAGQESESERLETEWAGFKEAYSLGYVWARTDAFGGNLKTIEFQGENLAATLLFRDAIPVVRFQRCGLRRQTVEDSGFPGSYELVKLGRRGFISLIAPAGLGERREKFKEVESVLRVLSRCSYIT